MARHGTHTQRDLFAAARTPESLPPEARQALLALLETLLLETTAPVMSAQEGRDEQDHA